MAPRPTYLTARPEWRRGSSPAELVEHGDVGIHVVDVVGVRGVLGDVPLLWFGALAAEHVTAVLGLVVHAVEARHLGDHQNQGITDSTPKGPGFEPQSPHYVTLHTSDL